MADGLPELGNQGPKDDRLRAIEDLADEVQTRGDGPLEKRFARLIATAAYELRYGITQERIRSGNNATVVADDWAAVELTANFTGGREPEGVPFDTMVGDEPVDSVEIVVDGEVLLTIRADDMDRRGLDGPE